MRGPNFEGEPEASARGACLRLVRGLRLAGSIRSAGARGFRRNFRAKISRKTSGLLSQKFFCATERLEHARAARRKGEAH